MFLLRRAGDARWAHGADHPDGANGDSGICRECRDSRSPTVLLVGEI
jgi:hypothetical protein